MRGGGTYMGVPKIGNPAAAWATPACMGMHGVVGLRRKEGGYMGKPIRTCMGRQMAGNANRWTQET